MMNDRCPLSWYEVILTGEGRCELVTFYYRLGIFQEFATVAKRPYSTGGIGGLRGGELDM